MSQVTSQATAEVPTVLRLVKALRCTFQGRDGALTVEQQEQLIKVLMNLDAANHAKVWELLSEEYGALAAMI